MDTPSQRRISAASVPITKPAGAMNSAFDTAAKASSKGRRGGAMAHLPPLALSATKAVQGPPPMAGGRASKGRTKYDAIFDALTQDGTGRTGIPDLYKSALKKALSVYLARRPELERTSEFVVRKDGEGMVGIWRVARAEA